MSESFLKLVNGVPTRTAAADESAGATDAGRIVALDNQGRLSMTLLPTGIGADTASVEATEALSAGDFVNIYNNGGVAAARKADASAAGKPAHGFVLASFASGVTAAVYFEGSNNQVAGQTPGSVWLSPTVPGGATSDAPTAAGQVVQRVGVATSGTSINAEIGQHYQL